MAPIHYPNGNDATLRVGKLAGRRSRGVMRAAGGSVLPDFTTALVAYAMWGLTPTNQVEDAVLGRANGSLASGQNFFTKGVSPFYCDIEGLIGTVGDTITVVRLSDQCVAEKHLNGTVSPPRFAYTSGDPLNGMSILNAGTAAVNADYVYYGIVNGRAAFSASIAASPLVDGIVWSIAQTCWQIFSGGVLMYVVYEDVATPDLVVGPWSIDGGAASPAPNVFTTELLYAEVNFIA